MSLTAPPTPPRLLRPGVPFLLTAVLPYIWDPTAELRKLHIAAASQPGARTWEYIIGSKLAYQAAQVRREELPIVLVLVERSSEWEFDYLGGPEWFDAHPPDGYRDPPTPRSPASLAAAEEQMLRESLGIPPGEPIPKPKGPLPKAQRPEEPYRFDPTPHLDLSTAEAAPALPPPAPPGPPPMSDAQTSPVPRIPAPVPRGVGAVGDRSVPFAH